MATMLLMAGLITSCGESSHDQMVRMLKEQEVKFHNPANQASPESQLEAINGYINPASNGYNPLLLNKADLLLKTGHEVTAVKTYENIVKLLGPEASKKVLPELAIAYMRLGERSNCMLNHNGSSCVFPIKDNGVHLLQTGSKDAINVYQQILRDDPNDLSSRWLLNIAYMTLGEYPKNVPPQFLLPGLDADTGYKVKPFTDMATDVGINVTGKAGGVIIDDFNNDGYLDVLMSSLDPGDHMHYFQNNKDGTFTDRTKESGLANITGGLNMQQTDYNNDGNIDVFVLRGAWNKNEFGEQPSSLLRGNGDGTFTDVTTKSGLLYFKPSETAVWADFNNDGWLDVYVVSETTPNGFKKNPCSLYINNHDGTFTNVADKAHCDLIGYIKGVTAGDYNNDGKMDLFVSRMDGTDHLLKNITKKGGPVDFEDVSVQSGISKGSKSFVSWFFDYNNDGWPDILTCNYDIVDPDKPLAYFSALEALKKPMPDRGNVILFRNNHDGTFTNVNKEAGLDKVIFAMGCNFGDIDNDGYPDMYFGTGDHDFKSLIPNKMFRNMDGKRFADVTISSRTGNLQKGHGVAFADLRNVGKQDIFAEMGSAYKGDSYISSLYVNPGQNDNNWISLKLVGVQANKAAIGSKLKLTFTENGVKRSVYKYVNSGGCFGAEPLRQEIGIGKAKSIDELEITWAGSQTVQRLKNIAPRQFLKITEGDDKPETINLDKLTFKKKPAAPYCGLQTANLKMQ